MTNQANPPPQGGGKIYAAILKVMQELEPIAKGRTNPQQGYSFRGIDDIYNAIQPLIAKHGIFTVPRIIDCHREERTNRNGGALIYTVLKVETTFCAEDGSSVRAETMGEAMDSGDKSANKAMSAAHKYAFILVFNIPTAELKDTENQTHEVVPNKATTGEAKLNNLANALEVQKTIRQHNDRVAPQAGPEKPDIVSAPLPFEKPNLRAVDTRPITEPQARRLYAIARGKGYGQDQVDLTVRNKYQCKVMGLGRSQYDEICQFYIDGPVSPKVAGGR